MSRAFQGHSYHLNNPAVAGKPSTLTEAGQIPLVAQIKVIALPGRVEWTVWTATQVSIQNGLSVYVVRSTGHRGQIKHWADMRKRLKAVSLKQESQTKSKDNHNIASPGRNQMVRKDRKPTNSLVLACVPTELNLGAGSPASSSGSQRWSHSSANLASLHTCSTSLADEELLDD